MNAIPFEELMSADLHVDALYRGGLRGNVGDDPIGSLLPVGNMGGFRYRGSLSTRIQLCVLYSELSDPDWPDSIMPELGRFTYFGDNKTPGHDVHDTPRRGNQILRDAFEAIHVGDRRSVPPFLIFTKAGQGRDVMFRGLAVPGAAAMSPFDDLVAVWSSRDGMRFRNYKAVFTILDTPVVSRRWIDALVANEPEQASDAPAAWTEWVSTGRYRPLLARRQQHFRSPSAQLPTRAADIELLEALHGYFADHPEGAYAFEKCAADLVKRMDSNVISIDVTRPWRDGGRDGVGRYRIGPRETSISVQFALEAKCKRPSSTNTSGVRETSRLVSRLRHRQFGIFVTTSCIGLQAYQELIEDEHPVLVLAGGDVVEVLRESGIDDISKLHTWLEGVAPKLPSVPLGRTTTD